MPEERVIVSAANYATAPTPEEAVGKIRASSLNHLPDHLRHREVCRVTEAKEVRRAARCRAARGPSRTVGRAPGPTALLGLPVGTVTG